MSEELSAEELIAKAQQERLVEEPAEDKVELQAEPQIEHAADDEVIEDAPPEFTAAEQEAYQKGWRPKEEFAGNPDDWVPADQFIARGPFMGQIVGLKKEVEILKEHMKKAEQAGYERAEREILAKKEAARQRNDFEGYEQANKELDELANKTTEKPTMSESVQQFYDNNSWFANPESGEDLVMKQEALTLSDLYHAQNPNASDATNIKMVVEALAVKYPHRFKNQSKVHSNTVGVQDRGARVTNNLADRFDKLPRGLKSLGEEYIKMGVYAKKEDYVKYLKESGRI